MAIKSIGEGEVRRGMHEGGSLKGFLVVVRRTPDATEYAIYLLPSWVRGYRILRTWGDRTDRTFRNFDRLLKWAASVGHDGPITVYRAGAPALQRIQGVRAEDGGSPDGRPPRASGPTDWRPFASKTPWDPEDE